MVYKKTTRLVREQARLHSELDIAARIQTGLLRRDFGGWKNSWVFGPGL
ncbi:MAG: hypothetical protein ACLTBV_20150 [Enterocloster bolteae]